jgi:hypothetical protein
LNAPQADRGFYVDLNFGGTEISATILDKQTKKAIREGIKLSY